jgi:subtilisin family serine protease
LYIVRLRGEPLATHMARQKSRVSPTVDLQGPTAAAYRSRLRSERSAALQAISTAFGNRVNPVYAFDVVLNGVALELTGQQAARIAALPQVLSVRRDQAYELTTDAGPEWIGADNIWDGTATGVYAATILGANEAPPVSSPASGRGIFNFDAASRELSYRIQVSGFTEAVTAAHFHRATDSSVVASLTAGVAGAYNGATTLSVADAALLGSGQLYVNFHTATNPAGEIRGDIAGYKGEGVVVGVIDSGINTTHPSFAEVGGDGYRHINPLGQGSFKGACDPANLPSRAQGNPSGYNPAIACNNKLIGAWTFTRTFEIDSPAGEPSPNDDDGHGTHTASTAAGNVVLNSQVNGVTFPRVSGVAPHANIIAYDVCGYKTTGGATSGSCPGVAIVAAVEQATKDQVDVINMSIGGGQDPWGDSTELAFLAAREAGVIVVTSAGNNGPAVSTVNHVSPWLLSVAASTHNRVMVNTLTDLAGGAALPNITGKGVTPALAPATPIVYAGAAGIDNALCAPFTDAQKPLVAGKIVICDRGNYGRVEKAANVQAAGGLGYVLANDVANGESLVADPFPIPGVHISYADGETLKSWVAATATPTARISGATSDLSPGNGDVMASFSSRGPAPDVGMYTIKPDIAAPGVDVYAAYVNDGVAGDDYDFLSGTSMASPHVAGASALMAGLYPSWTPGQVQSALMTTAKAPITKEDGATPTTPFDSGSGRIQVAAAAMAGLVFDENIANFEAADPLMDGDPRTLNVPSLTDPACVASCSWTRTVRNSLDAAVTWSVTASDSRITASPSSFTIAPGATQQLTFTVDVAGLPLAAYYFGSVTLAANGNVASVASLPVAVKPEASDIRDTLSFSETSGTVTKDIAVRTIAYSNLSVQRYGMVKGQGSDLALAENAEHVSTLVVPADTARVVADILSSPSQDIDLFIYQDDNDNGTLDGTDSEVCTSATGAVLEYCNMVEPAAGRYFVKVLNFLASAQGASDPVRLVTAVVPKSAADNFTVNAPGASAGGDATLQIAFNLPGSQAGDAWYGWLGLADGAPPTVFGATNLNYYHETQQASQIQASGGATQAATVGTAFALPLTVTVRDGAGNPVPGVPVSFSAPSQGASASLSTSTVSTDASGTASVTATANGTAGTYTVTATLVGATGPVSASFTLTNSAAPAASYTVYLPLVR